MRNTVARSGYELLPQPTVKIDNPMRGAQICVHATCYNQITYPNKTHCNSMAWSPPVLCAAKASRIALRVSAARRRRLFTVALHQ